MVRRLFLPFAIIGLYLAAWGGPAAGEQPGQPSATAGAEPVAVSAHPDPLAALADQDATRAANKQLVFDMWRSVVNAGQVQLADQMLREDYIQHSPVLPTGRSGFKQVFSAVPRREIPPVVSPPLVAILAEGDLVVMALKEEQTEPAGGRYTTTHFNLFRVQEGRLAEHWHSVEAVPGPEVPPPERGGPQLVTGLYGVAQLALLQSSDPVLAANKRLAFDAWRQTVEAGREELADLYFAENYIEHDPNGRSGRGGLKAIIAARPKGAIAPSLHVPLVAMVAQGDLVVMVTGREHIHPHRPGATYTTTRFDMFRIEHNRIAEHWSGLGKPGGTPAPYVN